MPPDPIGQNGGDFDLSTFFKSDSASEREEMSDWSLFTTPSFSHEFITDFIHTEIYTQSSAVDQNYGLPEQEDRGAAMISGSGVIWSMFANQLLP